MLFSLKKESLLKFILKSLFSEIIVLVEEVQERFRTQKEPLSQ